MLIKNIKDLKIKIVSIFRTLWPFILALLVFLGVGIAVREPRLVDHYYSHGIYPFIARSFSLLSNLIPFSLWDIFWVVMLFFVIMGLTLALFRKVKWRWLGLRVAQSLALLYSFFYLV